jgi:hypothetical protein
MDVVYHKPFLYNQILAHIKPLVKAVDYGNVIVDRTDKNNIGVGVEDGVYGVLGYYGVRIIL